MQQIFLFAENNRVKVIELYRNEMPITSSESSVLDSSSVLQTRDRIGLTGNGIKVGIVDNGIPANNNELNFQNITNVSATVVDDHATRMAITLAGTTGVAPNVKLYCTDWRDFYNNIEDLLTEGVIVVNMSLNWDRYEDMYTPREKWMDHIAIQHSVSFFYRNGE